VQLADGFESEINLRANPWVGSLSDILDAGAAILIDYGYPQSEYYHPQRSEGTLMCHYRHRTHPDPLLLPGLQDITAHVDFSAVADAGLKAGFEVEGFTTQTFFLMGCGLDSMLAESDPDDVDMHMLLAQQVRRLTLPTEMGERFKVLALSRKLEQPLIGFAMRDQRERL
jgi:SAM-dependent MidA family methyltransferase